MTENDSIPSSIVPPRSASTTNQLSKEPPNNNTIRSPTPPPPPTKEKSPTKFGKANPIRDLLLLLTILGLFLLFSPSSEVPKKKTEEEIEETNTNLNFSFSSLTSMLQNMAKDAANLRRKDHCSIFIHTSSIPNTGLSFFAGQNYTINDIILIDYTTLPVLVVNNNELDHDNESSSSSSKNIIYVSPSALILKHHPILHNVEGLLFNNDGMNDIPPKLQLRAAKTIIEGDELFVKYNPILHNNNIIFNHIPNMIHYNRTKDIVLDALRYIPDQTTRNGRIICRMVPVLRFLKHIIVQYYNNDIIISTLLPESYKRANLYRKLDSSIATLHNRTLLQLQQMGICRDDISTPKRINHATTTTNDTDNAVKNNKNNNNNLVTAVAQRHFRRGSIISTLPLHILNTSIATTTTTSSSQNDQTCSSLEQQQQQQQQQDCIIAVDYPQHNNNNCFIHDNLTTILFCPLGPNIVWYNNINDNDEHADPINMEHQKQPNVEYVWSQHKGVNEHFSMHDTFKYSTSITAWDVIALRDIIIGEKLIVNGMPNSIPDHIMSLYKEEQ